MTENENAKTFCAYVLENMIYTISIQWSSANSMSSNTFHQRKRTFFWRLFLKSYFCLA